MPLNRFAQLFPRPLPVIGSVRLPPLPDYPDSPGLSALIDFALETRRVLAEGGADGVLLVNGNDHPHRLRAQPETISAMTSITRAVVQAKGELAVGCEIRVNDPIAALAIARTSGADFIRADYFVDPMHLPELGVMMTDPDGLMAYRHEIGADDILVLADIQVKHATMMEERSLGESARQAALHLADAIVLTGSTGGEAPLVEDVREAVAGVALTGMSVPVLIGGGLDADNADTLLPACDGAIVGGAMIEDGQVEPRRVEAVLKALRRLRATE